MFFDGPACRTLCDVSLAGVYNVTEIDLTSHDGIFNVRLRMQIVFESQYSEIFTERSIELIKRTIDRASGSTFKYSHFAV